MRAWPPRLFALAVAATLLMPASALAQVVYLCKMSGSIGPRCCCSKPSEIPEAAPCDPAVSAPDCCEAQLRTAEDGVLHAGESAPTVGAAVLASTLRFAELTERASSSQAWARPQARGPPGIGPPVYLENCSLLR